MFHNLSSPPSHRPRPPPGTIESRQFSSPAACLIGTILLKQDFPSSDFGSTPGMGQRGFLGAVLPRQVSWMMLLFL